VAGSFWDEVARPASRRVSLLELDPDLGRGLDPERERAAALHVTVPVETLEPGPFERSADTLVGSLGFLVIDGVLMRSHSIGKVVSAELLGSGDVIRPPLTGHELSLIEAESRWEVLSAAQIAPLDGGFLKAVMHWPEIVIALFERSVQRSRFIAFQLALSHVRRVDARLLLLFWRLADRWGRVTPDGVVVPLRITHAALGKLTGAQRPSVTTALKHLKEDGRIKRRSDGSWLLIGDPPDAHDPVWEPLTAPHSHDEES
jgi:CRP/FNR family cyclic AMP-dependent transcriptional regulator